MKFTMEINLNNEGMSTSDAVVTALNGVASKIYRSQDAYQELEVTDGIIKDINGNTVGSWKIV